MDTQGGTHQRERTEPVQLMYRESMELHRRGARANLVEIGSPSNGFSMDSLPGGKMVQQVRTNKGALSSLDQTLTMRPKRPPEDGLWKTNYRRLSSQWL